MTITSKKGWVCLDIDGTITTEILSIPKETLNYLTNLSKDWQIVFVTGRTFNLATRPLTAFNEPYYLVVQNGASSFDMTTNKLLKKKYISVATLRQFQETIEKSGHDLVFFSGWENKEICYYRPDKHKIEVQEHFEQSLTKLANTWQAVSSFKDLPVGEVPYAKVYGFKKDLEELEKKLHLFPEIKTHVVTDSVNPKFSIIQIMRHDVDKGRAVLDLMNNSVLPSLIIAAGNDYNDHALLQVADIKIAMPDSPQCMLDIATIIASPVEEQGVIAALKTAIQMLEPKRHD